MGGFKVVSSLFTIEKKPVKGLIMMEWAMLIYVGLTALLVCFMQTTLESPSAMLMLRFQAVMMLLALWAVYRMLPCRFTMFLRVLAQMLLLGSWYPETFDFNRWLPNMDHIFATWEQQLFGFQPALVFCREWPQPLVSELLTLGYESYYPIMAIVPTYYLFRHYDEFPRTAFITLASFFVFYVLFLLMPAGGPQYYYPAAGMDNIEQGIFPNIGNFFQGDYEGLPIPGYKDGLMYHTLQAAHAAGERPTAAFPSSHVGVTVVLLLLAWRSGCRRLFWQLLPLGVLMFFATFYIQAHYAIDAMAGLVAGVLVYCMLGVVYDCCRRP